MIDKITVQAVMELLDKYSQIILNKMDHSQLISLPRGMELYRDRDQGFIFTVYAEQGAQYRIPHNHGAGWVIYKVLKGSMKMSEYKLFENKLIEIKNYRMDAGDTQIYRAGEIHDTECLGGYAIILRFTSCDLMEEEKAGRMKRFSKN